MEHIPASGNRTLNGERIKDGSMDELDWAKPFQIGPVTPGKIVDHDDFGAQNAQCFGQMRPDKPCSTRH